MKIHPVTVAQRMFSYRSELKEDIEIVLGLRLRRSKPLPPRFRNFSRPFTITHDQMRGVSK